MRHILLLLPFLMDGLLEDVVREHNRKYPLRGVYDPSSELIGITMLFIQWYMLYRRRFPPKDKVDVQRLTNLGDKCVHIIRIHTYFAYLVFSVLNITYSTAGIWNNVKLCFRSLIARVILTWPGADGHRKKPQHPAHTY